MTKKPFAELGLSPELLKAVAKIGFEEASPIQVEAIPRLLAGEDLVGLSQTGSGKTAAYAIPAIEQVDPAVREPQVLILCPTRELAVQVAEEVAHLAQFKRGVRELPIYGGSAYDRQLRGLRAGAQILIATPGRLMDHLERGSVRLERVRMVILDEADRMLDMGFRDDIDAILKQAPAERQTAFFSATLAPPIQQLIKRHAKTAATIRIESHQVTVPAIEQIYYEVDRRSKLEVLCRLIDLQDIQYALVFCATKIMVDELADHLAARGYSCDKLHGGIAQATRERVMAKFRRRGIDLLVATDVAARGLDVDDIEVVFNYDLPQDAEDYVHRIGRTGRAGRSGRAITFVAGREIYKLQQIMKFTKARVRRERVPSAEQVEAKRTSQLFDALRETLERGEYRHHDDVVDQLLEQGHSPTEIASALIDMLGREGGRVADERPARPPARALPADGAEDAERSDVARGPGRARPTPTRPTADARTVRARAGDQPALPGRARPAGSHPPRPNRESPARAAGGGRRTPAAPFSHEAGMTRLAMNVGSANGIAAGDVVGVLAGLAGLQREEIGAIEVLDRRILVDVADERVHVALKKLHGIRFKGNKLSIVPARE